MMNKTCDNCKNQDDKKYFQDCNTEGYPLYKDCDNWELKDGFINIPNELPCNGLPII